jgi:NAD(P)-dependent dehydrogenase (short-subunit alcohol dehydrogenase family)
MQHREVDLAYTRPVLITGCSSGIGRACAERLRSRGFRVFAAARQPADVAELARAGFEAVALDLDSPASIRLGLASVLAATGGHLHGLVSNAAYGQPGAVEDLSRAALRAQLETNVLGTIELVNLVIPVMRAQSPPDDRGRLVFVSSILGLVAMPMRGAYSASKYALEGLVDTLRLELRSSGIRVATINPGAIETRFREHAIAAADLNVDVAGSVHAKRYAALRRRNEAAGGKMPFSLPPEAVAAKVQHALESRRPRAHYFVTLPAHALHLLKRLLPVRWLDALLAKL